MNSIAIRVTDVTVDFHTVRALDHLSFEVPAGIIFGFLGPNGAGKTTTIRILLGLQAPTSGHAEVLGFDSTRQGDFVRQRTGALFEPGLYERLTAVENLEFYARVWRMPVATWQPRFRELLGHFGLWERRKERIEMWSRGMKQKLAVVRTMLHRPSLIFLDEPTTGLDPLAAAALNDDLLTLTKDRGVTVFLTTHNLAEAQKLCALVGILRQGRLLAVGSPDALQARMGAHRIEISGRKLCDGMAVDLRRHQDVVSAECQDGRIVINLRQDAAAAPLIRYLVESGAEIEEVHRVQQSLEDVFMALVEGR